MAKETAAPDPGGAHKETRQHPFEPGDVQLPVEEIVCGGCGRAFWSSDAPRMLRAITGSCPDCGGRFELA